MLKMKNYRVSDLFPLDPKIKREGEKFLKLQNGAECFDFQHFNLTEIRSRSTSLAALILRFEREKRQNFSRGS